MLKIYRIFIFLILILFTIGCNNGEEVNNADEIKNEIIQAMEQQKNYSFEGSTSLNITQNNMEDVIKFSGFINEKNNMYLDLNIASIQGMPEEKMEVINSANKMKVKYEDTEQWQTVSQEEYAIFNEFQSWNPEYILSEIGKAIDSETIQKKNETQGIKVYLDSNIVKEQLEEQMRMQLGGAGFTDEEIQQMKEDYGLTDEEIAELSDDLNKQMQDTEQQINQMMETITVEAYYEVYYDSDSLLIEEIVQVTNTKYQVGEENIEENMVLKMNFSDYGKENQLPAS